MKALDIVLCCAAALVPVLAIVGGIALREPRYECTVREVQRNVTTIRTGRLKYEGRAVVCELGGE